MYVDKARNATVNISGRDLKTDVRFNCFSSRTSATKIKDDPLWRIVFMDDLGWKWTPIEVEQKNYWDQLKD